MIPTGPVIRRRIAFSMAVFLQLFLLLAVRLFVLQVIKAEELTNRAKKQWTMESVIRPKRGAILDRNGMPLAKSGVAYTLSVSPRQVSDAKELTNILVPLLGMDEKAILERVSDTRKGGVTVKRQLDYALAQQIRLMMASAAREGLNTFDGVYLEEDAMRYYPNGACLTQLIGLTTVDGVGQSGLEASLNNYLSGKTGSVVYEIDGKGRTLDYDAGEYVSAVNGSTVTLTIDTIIQGICEKAAREAMEVNRAEGVRIIAMNPGTGEIYAMVTKPDYDPNSPPRDDVQYLTSLMRNRAVADAYEPGSTFKMITMAACIEEGLAHLSDGFYCTGSIAVEGGRVRCWGNPHGAQTLTEALENSCNPAFVELGLRLGPQTFYKYLDAFGFGSKTGVDIPGEGSGIVIAESAVKRGDIARIGFGQSIAVTPIQLLRAGCAVVNGGNLLQPYVVKEIRDPEGNLLEVGEPKVIGRPISENTSAVLREMLESVVTQGGGKNAYIDGLHVGGKTGTAQVYVDGAVSQSLHIGSFIGFAPMDDPVIAVLVIVDKAHTSPDFGSVTAAPFAREILLQSLSYLGVVPEGNEAAIEKTAVVPDVREMTLSKAVKALRAEGLNYTLTGTGERVIGQMPAPGASVHPGALVALEVEENGQRDPDAYVRVPCVTGLSVMEANRMLASYGLLMKINGSGIARAQSPAAGELVFPTQTVCVDFEMPDSG